jgi:hypothetical protein
MEVNGQRYAPASFSTGKRPVTYCILGWVGPSTGLEGCGKFRPPPPGFDPGPSKSVASSYTD